MAWRIEVRFPEQAGDETLSFTHRVGNLQEAVYSKLRDVGGGSIDGADLDRVGYAFTVAVPRNRDIKAVTKLVQKLSAAHIPERGPILTPEKV